MGNQVNLSLGHDFIVPRKGNYSCIDALNMDLNHATRMNKTYKLNYKEKFYLHPNELVLANTFETVKLPADLQGYVTSRSKWGRLGLLIATATLIHPGFTGTITLELVNHGQTPIALYPGFSIAQIAFTECVQAEPYNGDLANQNSALFPDIKKDKNNEINFWTEGIFNAS